MPAKVAIIGAGPAGIAAARAILDESDFEVDLYEARPTFGGLWNYSPVNGPMYRYLRANITRDVIGFPKYPFPSGIEYPTRQEVLRYLQSYARLTTQNPRAHTHFNQRVISVSKRDNVWQIEVEDDSYIKTADYVVLAAGHYEFPYFPPIPGLQRSPVVTHSIEYDIPNEFRHQKVLIIGNSRSATDIAIQLLSVTAPITISRRRIGATDFVFSDDANAVEWKPEVAQVLNNHEVVFSDGTTGTYDRIISATGYRYVFPFLKLKGGEDVHHPSNLRFQNLYMHTFYNRDPSLATLAINKGMVPFPTMEAQAVVIARAWTQKISLPNINEIREFEAETSRINGDGEKFHDLTNQRDLEFLNRLWDWSEQSSDGFRATRWTEEQFAARIALEKHKVEDYKLQIRDAYCARYTAGDRND